MYVVSQCPQLCDRRLVGIRTFSSYCLEGKLGLYIKTVMLHLGDISYSMSKPVRKGHEAGNSKLFVAFSLKGS